MFRSIPATEFSPSGTSWPSRSLHRGLKRIKLGFPPARRGGSSRHRQTHVRRREARTLRLWVISVADCDAARMPGVHPRADVIARASMVAHAASDNVYSYV